MRGLNVNKAKLPYVLLCAHLALACGTDTIRHNSTETDAGRTDAGSRVDASADSGIDGGMGDAGRSDSGSSDAGQSDAGLQELPSIQTITYRLINRRDIDVFVVLDGWDCTPFDPGVPTRLSFQCGCECPPPPDPGPTRYVRIPPAGQYDLQWDGRGLVTWTTTLACGPDFTVEMTNAVRVPIESISAPTRIAYETKLPAGCNAGADANVFDCEPAQNGLGPGPVLSELCSTENEVLAPLVLREGDILIEVPIEE
ncbi:MAG: hypothetical protein AAFN74_19960 [Myxococcota bacterium]